MYPLSLHDALPISAVRGIVLPRAHRPRLRGHREPRGRGEGAIRTRSEGRDMSEQKPPQDPFEMFRRLWGPLGVPLPGMAMPTLDPQELDKRIADLRSIEAWLSMNLNMVKFSIQGLELQRAALQAMRSVTGPAKDPKSKGE